MNGWQRLWLVGTVLAVLFALLYPVQYLGKSRDFIYRYSIQKDYANPVCAPFLNQPFGQLVEPPYGEGNCWHIYTTRRFEDSNKAFATFTDWVAEDDREYWSTVGGFSLGAAIGALILAGIVYLVGMIVAWIIRGFRSSN